MASRGTEKVTLKKGAKKNGNLSFEDSILGAFSSRFGVSFGSQFLGEKRVPPVTTATRVYGFTGGAQRSYLTKVK